MNEMHLILQRLGIHIEVTHYLQVIVKTAGALLAAFVVWKVINHLLSKAESRSSTSNTLMADIRFFRILKKVIFYVLVLITGTYLIRLFSLEGAENFFHAILIILICIPLKDFVLWSLGYLEKNLVSKTETKIDDILFEIVNKFAGVIIFSIAVVLALDTLGVNVMPFVAGAGVAGIAIGFAAKDTLSNLIAGVLLIIDRPFEVGDRIEVWNAPAGSASWGDVIDIGLRATKIRTTDNIIVIIPNNAIMKRDIVNYTIYSNRIRVRVNIGVAYDADIAKARKVVIDVALSADWILRDPEPKVVVRNFGESSVDLQLRVWINDARKRMDTISYVTDHVKEAFDSAGIEIPYPKRDIVITKFLETKKA